MSLEFVRKQRIEYIVEVNIYHQVYRERMEINMIDSQKWSVILVILWLAYHNSKINWRVVKVLREDKW